MSYTNHCSEFARRVAGRYDASSPKDKPSIDRVLLERVIFEEFEKEEPANFELMRQIQTSRGLTERVIGAARFYSIRSYHQTILSDVILLELYNEALSDLPSIPKFGKKSLELLKEYLTRRGLLQK